MTDLKTSSFVCQKCNQEYEIIPTNMTNGLCFTCNFKMDNYTVPKYLKNKTFDNFKTNDNNKQAFELAKNFKESEKGLYVYGSVGSGKTHLSVSACYELSWKGYRNYKFLSMPRLLLEIKDTFKKDSYSSQLDVVEQYFGIPYLFLDDMGSESITDFTVEALFVLLDERLKNNAHKIFITSNLSLNEVSKKITDRISSRIVEMCDVIQIKDKDHRGEK